MYADFHQSDSEVVAPAKQRRRKNKVTDELKSQSSAVDGLQMKKGQGAGMVKCQNRLIEFVQDQEAFNDCDAGDDVEARFSKLKLSEQLRISKPKV